MRDITRLSDSQLLSTIELLVARERRITLDVLIHLAEIDRRRLYAPLGYNSLFDYCRRRLRYSESAANRRIRTARCLRLAPELCGMLESGEASVATVSMIASLLTSENRKELLAAISGKSQSDVEAIVSTHHVGKPVRDRIKPVTVAKAGADHALFAAPLREKPSTKMNGGRGSSASHLERQVSDRPGGGKKLAATPTTARCFKFEFGADEHFMKRFNEVKSLMSSKFPGGAGLASIFQTLMDDYLDRHSPRRRAQRRERTSRSTPRATGVVRGFAGTAGNPASTKTRRSPTRHIPRPTRDEVYRRDGGRCTFVGPDGVRCDSAHDVEVDHRVPFSRGGGHDSQNLRLLCRTHNRAEAERLLGRFRPKR